MVLRTGLSTTCGSHSTEVVGDHGRETGEHRFLVAGLDEDHPRWPWCPIGKELNSSSISGKASVIGVSIRPWLKSEVARGI
jgi:hypothetical protein